MKNFHRAFYLQKSFFSNYRRSENDVNFGLAEVLYPSPCENLTYDQLDHPQDPFKFGSFIAWKLYPHLIFLREVSLHEII